MHLPILECRSSQPAPSDSSFPLTRPCSPSSLPSYSCRAPTLPVWLAPLSPAFLKQPPKDKSWSSGIPLHLSQSDYPFLSRGMIFIQAIFFSFLPCIFSSSAASFKFAFPSEQHRTRLGKQIVRDNHYKKKNPKPNKPKHIGCFSPTLKIMQKLICIKTQESPVGVLQHSRESSRDSSTAAGRQAGRWRSLPRGLGFPVFSK